MTQCDDSYCGTNFDRPSVKALLNEVRAGNIQCNIVKDLSRFGRSYINIGDYWEQIFLFLGIRFISVNDRFHSNDFDGTTSGLDVEIRNYANELGFNIAGISQYIGGGLDFSRKVLPETKQVVYEKNVDDVLVSNVSHVGRDILKTTAYIKEINTSGAEFLSPTDSIIDIVFRRYRFNILYKRILLIKYFLVLT